MDDMEETMNKKIMEIKDFEISSLREIFKFLIRRILANAKWKDK